MTNKHVELQLSNLVDIFGRDHEVSERYVLYVVNAPLFVMHFRLSICPSVCLSVRLSVHLSVTRERCE